MINEEQKQVNRDALENHKLKNACETLQMEVNDEGAKNEDLNETYLSLKNFSYKMIDTYKELYDDKKLIQAISDNYQTIDNLLTPLIMNIEESKTFLNSL